MAEKRGWEFPSEDVVPPDHMWYRMDFGDDSAWDMDGDGHRWMLRKHAENDATIKTSLEATGEDSNGVLWAAATATATIDGEQWQGVGGVDATSNQVRQPEYLWSVAATRALKRAVKMAVGVFPASGDTSTDPEATAPEGTGSPSPDAPDHIDSPPSEWDEPADTDDGAADPAENNLTDDDGDWDDEW